MGVNLDLELDFFAQKESKFIRDGHHGDYVAIHDRQVLAFGKDPDEVVRNLLAKFPDPPEPILIRQILGEERRPLRMRSPRIERA
jgi:hypothetical protein